MSYQLIDLPSMRKLLEIKLFGLEAGERLKGNMLQK
jgi:hypothetical protein